MASQKIRLKLTIFFIITLTAGVFFWIYEKKQDTETYTALPLSQKIKKNNPVPLKNTGGTLQTYKNDKYGYEFRYSPSLVITPDSTAENILLSEKDNGRWKNSVAVSLNNQKQILNQALEEQIKLFNKEGEDAEITDMLIGYRHAKKYSIKNYAEYGDTRVILIDNENIIIIAGDERTLEGKRDLEFILRSFDLNSIDAPKIPNQYFRDTTGIYYIEQFNILSKLKDADNKTFQILGNCGGGEIYYTPYSQDKDHVYVGGNIQTDIDAKTFKYYGLFTNYYGIPWGVAIAKDKNHIYYGCGKIAKSIRKESFEILKYGYAKDSKNIFFLHSILKVDYKTFEILGIFKVGNHSGPFAIDKNNVYFEEKIIKGISSIQCKEVGIESCLPKNWIELLEESSNNLSLVY